MLLLEVLLLGILLLKALRTETETQKLETLKFGDFENRFVTLKNGHCVNWWYYYWGL